MAYHHKAAAPASPPVLLIVSSMLSVRMFRVFSAVLLVCVCVCSVCVSADLPGDFGLKLCGREFIRAVIFTCGGSRWRRADAAHSDVWLDSYQDDELGSSLSSLLQLQTDGQSRQTRAQTAADGLSAWLQTFFSSAPAGGVPRPRPDRRKRNFSLGLAGMCCNLGCTKNDIGRLC